MDPGQTRTITDAALALSGDGIPDFRDALGELLGGFDVKVQATKRSAKKDPRKKKEVSVCAEKTETGANDSSPGTAAGVVDNVRTCCECPVCRGPLLRAMLSPCGHAVCSRCLGMLTAAAQTAAPTADISPYETSDAPSTPLCPTCRAPVHRDLYVRCFALDAVVNAAHPGISEESSTDRCDAEAEEPSFQDLRAWKAAQDEQLVQQALKAIWSAVKVALPTSTALLLSGEYRLDDDDCPSFRSPSRHLGINLARGNARFIPVGMDDQRPSQADVCCAGISSRVMETILMGGECMKEIARRLQSQGLSLEVFTSRGKRFALIRWPVIPPAFSPASLVAISEVSGGGQSASRPPKSEALLSSSASAEPPSILIASSGSEPEEGAAQPASIVAKLAPGPRIINESGPPQTSTAPPPRAALVKKSNAGAAAPARMRK